MRVLGLDVGSKTIGIAVSDALKLTAQGITTLQFDEDDMSSADQATMYQMMSTLRSLDTTMKQGISINGQFVQRGSDLVAVVNRTNSRTGADLLSNVAYAR